MERKIIIDSLKPDKICIHLYMHSSLDHRPQLFEVLLRDGPTVSVSMPILSLSITIAHLPPQGPLLPTSQTSATSGVAGLVKML